MQETPEMPTESQMLFAEIDAGAAQKTVESVMEDVQRMADDDRYSDKRKQEKIQERMDVALIELEQDEAKLEKLASRISALKKLGRVGGNVSPPVEHAAAMIYTRDLLSPQWQKDNPDDIDPIAIMDAWSTAVTAEDRITSKIYADHAYEVIRGLPRMADKQDQLANLMSATENLFLTDSERTAREYLQRYEGFHHKLSTDLRMARYRLQNSQFRNGKLVDATAIKLNKVGI